jgi:hypothetical protein
MKHLRRLLTVLFLFVFFKASATSDNTTLVVELHDGNTANFLLADKPKITFTAQLMSIVSDAFSMDFDRSDVKMYRFVNEDVTTSVKPAVKADAKVSDNTFLLSGVDAGTAIVIYNANGMVVKRATSVDGGCSISLDGLATGAYIVTFNNTTFKFLKR